MSHRPAGSTFTLDQESRDDGFYAICGVTRLGTEVLRVWMGSDKYVAKYAELLLDQNRHYVRAVIFAPDGTRTDVERRGRERTS